MNKYTKYLCILFFCFFYGGVQSQTYDRTKAIAYAEKWWNGFNTNLWRKQAQTKVKLPEVLEKLVFLPQMYSLLIMMDLMIFYLMHTTDYTGNIEKRTGTIALLR